MQVHSLGTDQLLCVIPHHWSSWVDTDDLTARGPFIICTSDQPLWITLRKALYLSRRFPPKPWIAVDDLEGARALILSGMGWGILPLTLIAEDLRARTVQVWENPPWKLPSRHCVVLWRRDCEDPFDRTTLQAWQRVMQAGRGNT